MSEQERTLSASRPDLTHRWSLGGRRVFLSASIPNREWEGEFDPLEITDAVVASVSAVWAAGGRILCGGHPAITPLLLRVALDFRTVAEKDQGTDAGALVTVYQSRLYEKQIPEPTLRLQATGLGYIEFISAVPGDHPRKGRNTASLDRMRKAMLAKENDPAIAIFIGGMDGIRAEYNEFHEHFPERPVYAIGAPGGVARELAVEFTDAQAYSRVDARQLLRSAEYGALMDDVLVDATTRLGS
jgi:SLOG cluster3 family